MAFQKIEKSKSPKIKLCTSCHKYAAAYCSGKHYFCVDCMKRIPAVLYDEAEFMSASDMQSVIHSFEEKQEEEYYFANVKWLKFAIDRISFCEAGIRLDMMQAFDYTVDITEGPGENGKARADIYCTVTLKNSGSSITALLMEDVPVFRKTTNNGHTKWVMTGTAGLCLEKLKEAVENSTDLHELYLYMLYHSRDKYKEEQSRQQWNEQSAYTGHAQTADGEAAYTFDTKDDRFESQAFRVFGLAPGRPFTKKELRKIYVAKMKEAHEDVSHENSDLSRVLSVSYEYLVKKYC